MTIPVTIEKLENQQLEMTIEVDDERVERELQKAARKLAKQYRIPGFRKGKAPYAILRQYIGLPALYEEFADSLGQELFEQALEQEEIEPYGRASMTNIEFNPMRYTLIIPLEPKVDIGDYRSLRVEEPIQEVTDEDVEEQLSVLRTEYVDWTSVDRPSQYGDLMIVDVHSVLVPIAEDEEEQIVLEETDWQVTLDEDDPTELPGFDEELLGLKAGDTKEFDIEWSEDRQSIYAGRTAHFSILVKQVKALEEPELNDEFAALIGPDVKTIDELRASIRASLEAELEDGQEEAYLASVLDALLEQSSLVYPPAAVENTTDRMVQEFDRQLRQMGMQGIDTYLGYQQMTMEAYRESLYEKAVYETERGLLLEEIKRYEDLAIEDEEIRARVREMLGMNDDEVEITEQIETDVEASAEADTEASTGADAEASLNEQEVELPNEVLSAADDADLDEQSGAEDEDVADESVDSEQQAQLDQLMEAFVSGPNRTFIEEQLRHERAVERLLAIARGEEVPPQKQPEASAPNSESDAMPDSETDSEPDSKNAQTEIDQTEIESMGEA